MFCCRFQSFNHFINLIYNYYTVQTQFEIFSGLTEVRVLMGHCISAVTPCMLSALENSKNFYKSDQDVGIA